MSNLSRFRERNQQRIVANKQLNSKFIFNGYPSILLEGDGESVQAAVVNQQEKDKAYIFTKYNTPIKVGSAWSAKDLHLLVTEEIVLIKDVDWRKYIALPCNFKIDNHWGYFRGPQKTYINISLKEDSIIESEQKPVLALPSGILGFRDKIILKGRAWQVQEYDALSTEGITYYSLAPATADKNIAAQKTTDTYIEYYTEEPITIPSEPVVTPTGIRVSPNVDIKLATEGGYFKFSNANIIVKKRTSSEVIFALPFGVSEVRVETKQKGDIVVNTYRVE